MRQRYSKDLLAGALFLAFGLAFLVVAQGYPLGSARRMGPAYFPVVLSLMLIGIGLATMARACIVPGPALQAMAGKALALVTTGIALFGLLVQGAGLGIAAAMLVIVSAAASRRFRILPALLLAAALAAFCIVVFAKGLGLPFPALGAWLRG